MATNPRVSPIPAPLAFHYLRFSTPEQGAGNSFHRQYERAQDWCETNGVIYDDSLRFEDLGVSGYSGKHRRSGALAAFLKNVKEGKIPIGSYLLFEAWDRLSREGPYEAIDLLTKLINAGIVLVYLQTGQIITREALNKGPLLNEVQAEFDRSHRESLRKSDLIGYAWQWKRKNATNNLTSICPGWLQAQPSKTGFVFIQHRVDIVRQIVADTLNGKGAYSIARSLNLQGVATWGKGRKQAKLWHKSYISKILRNPALIGDLQPHRIIKGKRVPDGALRTGYFPAVITPEEWERLNPITRPVKIIPVGDGSGIPNLFSGLAVDQESGLSMVRQMKGYGVAMFSAAMGGPGWRYDHFELCVLLFFRYLDLDSLLAERQEDPFMIQREIAEEEAKRLKCEEKMNNLLATIEAGGGAAPAILIAQASKREKELKAFDAKLRKLHLRVKTAQPAPQTSHTLRDLFDQRHDQEVRLRLRLQIRQLVDRIEVDARVRYAMEVSDPLGTLILDPQCPGFSGFRSSPVTRPVGRERRDLGSFRSFTLHFKNGAWRKVIIPLSGKASIFQLSGGKSDPHAGGSGASAFPVPDYPKRTMPKRDENGHFIKTPAENAPKKAVMPAFNVLPEDCQDILIKYVPDLSFLRKPTVFRPASTANSNSIPSR